MRPFAALLCAASLAGCEQPDPSTGDQAFVERVVADFERICGTGTVSQAAFEEAVARASLVEVTGLVTLPEGWRSFVLSEEPDDVPINVSGLLIEPGSCAVSALEREGDDVDAIADGLAEVFRSRGLSQVETPSTLGLGNTCQSFAADGRRVRLRV